jgi:hypothetical protein
LLLLPAFGVGEPVAICSGAFDDTVVLLCADLAEELTAAMEVALVVLSGAVRDVVIDERVRLK